MGKPRKEHPDEESIFANNPFIEGFFEWMDSPEGEKHLEIYDALSKLLKSDEFFIFFEVLALWSWSATHRSMSLSTASSCVRE